MNRPSQRDLVRISARPSAPAVSDSQGVRKIGGAVTVRAARLGDMKQVEGLINRFARSNLMLPKTVEHLNRNFRDWSVPPPRNGCATR